MSRITFPADFLWGTATSSYQIEGSLDVGGRGESVWDRFATVPGAVSDGSNGAHACEHFTRWREDVALMRALEVKAYRFSVAWPRVFPNGSGAPVHSGLDFYDKLVDGLLAAGIVPFLTLNHWDMPQALDDAGGWGAREAVDRFVDYADVVSRRLGDRVRHWTTHNEPWCMAHLGHQTGEHAPGRKNPEESLRAAHHLLLSHGRAVPVLRANAPGAEVGIVVNLVPSFAASPSAADAEALRAFDGFFNRWYLDPLFKASYPADAIADRVKQGHLPSAELTFVRDGDLQEIAAPIDYLGINYYSRAIIRSADVAEQENAPRTIPVPGPEDVTDMGWEVYPDGLRAILLRVHRDYRPRALYVTENGAAYPEEPNDQGIVADARREHYVREHLRAVHGALEEGAPVRGYFLWSLLDNFEWQFGYSKRFGMVHVDYRTQARTAKESAKFYRSVIRANALVERA